MAQRQSSNRRDRAHGEHLTEADVAHLKEMLLQKRAAIGANVGEIESQALNHCRSEASGDLSHMPIHPADVGTESYNQDLALSLADEERRLLADIDAA